MYTQLPQIYFNKLSYAQIGKINLIFLLPKRTNIINLTESIQLWYYALTFDAFLSFDKAALNVILFV